MKGGCETTVLGELCTCEQYKLIDICLLVSSEFPAALHLQANEAVFITTTLISVPPAGK